MHLNGHASGRTQHTVDFLFVVIRSVARVAIKFSNLQAIDEGVDLWVFTGYLDSSSIPAIQFPGFDPCCRSTSVFEPAVFGLFVLVCRDSNQILVIVLFAVDIERSSIETSCPFAINVTDVSSVMVIDHHLKALTSVIATDE